jgi:hypothetical protein
MTLVVSAFVCKRRCEENRMKWKQRSERAVYEARAVFFFPPESAPKKHIVLTATRPLYLAEISIMPSQSTAKI